MPAMPRCPLAAAASATPLCIPRPSSRICNRRKLRVIFKADLHPSRVRMLEYVHHRLASDAQRSCFELGRQWSSVSLGRKVERDGGTSHDRANGPVERLGKSRPSNSTARMSQIAFRASRKAASAPASAVSSATTPSSGRRCQDALNRAKLNRDARESLKQRIVKFLGDTRPLRQRRHIAGAQTSSELRMRSRYATHTIAPAGETQTATNHPTLHEGGRIANQASRPTRSTRRPRSPR